jgi:hypothetical protein
MCFIGDITIVKDFHIYFENYLGLQRKSYILTFRKH